MGLFFKYFLIITFDSNPVIVAEWSRTPISKIQVALVTGSNTDWDYEIDCSEFEITWRYSNSRAPGDL